MMQRMMRVIMLMEAMMQVMMRVIMLMQAIMQVMGDGGVRDNKKK
jgi:hypothetical protein